MFSSRGEFGTTRDKPIQVSIDHLTLDLKMASAQVVETSVANNSLSQDSSQTDNHFRSEYVTPRFKLFSSSVKFGGTYPLNSDV